MSQSPDVLDTSSEVDDGLSVEDLISVYLRWNPTPSDDQVHQLAEMCGIPYQDFEATVYRMFGEFVGEAEDEAESQTGLDEDVSAEDIAEDLVDDEDDIDALDLFIISYFLRNPDPTDIQIHLLSQHLSLTPDQLEERVFALMAETMLDEDEADDQDE